MKDIQDIASNKSFFSTGTYRLLQLLGPSPLSRTYLVELQDMPGKKMVLKIMEAAPLSSEAKQAQVLQEVQTRQSLQHPYILALQKGWFQEHVLYLITPYAEAGSLRQRIAIAPGSPLPLKEAIIILRGIGEALHFAHQHNIVHANLKPENILLQPDGSPLLVDFLLPSLLQSERAMQTYSTFIAPYTAPEQFQTNLATPLSDQYALACLACELLTGSTPFQADSFNEMREKHLAEQPLFPLLSNHEQIQYLEKIVLKALEKQPANRYPDVQAFIDVLSGPPPLAPYIQNIQTTILPVLTELDLQPELILNSPLALQAPSDASSAPTAQRSPLLIEPGPQAGKEPRMLPARPVKKRLWLLIAFMGLILALMLSVVVALLQPTTTNNSDPAPGVSQSDFSHTTATSNSVSTASTTPQNIVTPTPKPTPTPAPSPTATATKGITATVESCAVSYTLTSKWDTGFVASVQLTNASPVAINGWTLTFRFTGNVHITRSWSGNFTQNGQTVKVTNADFNSQIPASSSVSLGFQANASNHTTPSAFTLNGTGCSVSSGS